MTYDKRDNSGAPPADDSFPNPSASAHNVEEPKKMFGEPRAERTKEAEATEMALHETTVMPCGEDEVYAEWFECGACGCDTILKKHRYCPNCGCKIIPLQDAQEASERSGTQLGTEMAKNLAAQLYKFMDASGFIARGLNGRELDALDSGLIIRIQKCLSEHAPKSDGGSGFPQTDSGTQPAATATQTTCVACGAANLENSNECSNPMCSRY